jgi:branched-chain amino acid transport system substrate-binding protein
MGQPPGATLAVGALFPLSGPLAPLGDESLRGVEMAVAARNAAGGLAGRALRLVRADAQDEAASVAEARRLIATERVAALFGSLVSAVALPASQVAELASIPFFELGAKADALLERGQRLVFRASPSAEDFAATSLTALTTLIAPAFGAPAHAMRIGILHEDGPGGRSVARAQARLAAAAGLTLVDPIAQGAPGFGAALARLRGEQVDILLHTGAPGEELLLFRAFREAGWRPRMLIGTASGYGLAETARAIGDPFLGAISVDLTPFAVDEAHAPGASGFAEAYLRRYGMPPRSGHGLAAFVGAGLFLDAMGRAGGLEAPRLRAAILALDQPEGTTGTGWGARFDERGQNQRARPLICQWQASPTGPRQVALLGSPGGVAPLVPRLG